MGHLNLLAEFSRHARALERIQAASAPSRPFFSLRSAEEDEPPFVGPWARAGDVVRPSTGDGRRCGEVSRDDTGEEVSDPGFELDRDMFGDV